MPIFDAGVCAHDLTHVLRIVYAYAAHSLRLFCAYCTNKLRILCSDFAHVQHVETEKYENIPHAKSINLNIPNAQSAKQI